MSEWMQKNLEGKRAARRRLATSPFTEKVRILEQLRDRSRAIAESPLGRKFRRG
jgi:hypothetical protein